MREYKMLEKVSSYEKGAHMLGVGEKNAKGIDAVDFDNAKGISLKGADNRDRVREAAGTALASAQNAGFHDVQVYIDAPTVSKDGVTALPDIQKTLGDGTITKVVIFTKEGVVEYLPNEVQQNEIRQRQCKEKNGGACQ